jgi:hypothetical protein
MVLIHVMVHDYLSLSLFTVLRSDARQMRYALSSLDRHHVHHLRHVIARMSAGSLR